MTKFTAVGLMFLGLTGCQNPGTMPVSQLAQDANIEAAGLAAIVAALPSSVPQADKAKMQGLLANVQTLAQELLVAPGGASQNLTQQAIQDVKLLVPLVMDSSPALAPWLPAVQAAEAMIPLMLAEAGLPQVTGAAKPPAMSPEEIRLRLETARITLRPKQ